MRNYAHLELEPSPGLNVFVGNNAQGKSNLLEAIALLGTGKSFRTNRERDVIRDGFELATINGEAEVAAGSVRLACTLTSTARGFRKMYAINGRSVRYATYLGNLRVVSFVPGDLQLVGGPPALRRSFLNAALAQDRRFYYRELARYQKTLSQKAAMLRGEGEPDSDLLKIYNETLIEAGTQLMLARSAFIAALAPIAARMHAQWSGDKETLEVRYEPNVRFDVPAEDAVAGAFASQLAASAMQERERRSALVGPHRDDLALLVDGRSLDSYGSQGQQRSAVLALKVAEYSVMRERAGEAPLLLLDDVLSELDADRARAFVQGVAGFEQAFVTATQSTWQLPAARSYRIEGATLCETAG